MELGHLLTRSGLTYPEVSSKVYHDFFCQLENSVSWPNLSGFFPWDLPVVKISPEWVTDPEQGKSSDRTATFNLWTDMLKDGISSIPGYTAVTQSSFLRLFEQGIPREGEDDCWVE